MNIQSQTDIINDQLYNAFLRNMQERVSVYELDRWA